MDGTLVIGNNNAHFDAVFDLPIGTHVIDLIVSNDIPDSDAWTFVGVGKCLWGTDENIAFVKAGREMMTSPTIFDLSSQPLPNWGAKGWDGPDWENFTSEGFMFAPNGSFFECGEEDRYQLYSVVINVVTDAFGHVIPIDIDGGVDLFLDGDHLYYEENTHFDAVLDLPTGRHKIELSVREWDDRASIGVGKCLWGTDPNISFVKSTIDVPSDYPTIQEGINAANPGDTVFVYPGTYNETIILKSGVKLQGSGTDFTTIDGGSNGSVVKMSGISDVTISGFTITNGLGDGQDYYYADNGGGIAVYECANIMIRDNIITQNRAEGGHADGGGILICKCPGDITILHNSITDNYAQHWGGGISIQGTFNVQIHGNDDISNNNAGVGGGISLWEGDPAEGASAWIHANRITDNQGDGIYIGDDCSAHMGGGGNLDDGNDIIGNTEYAVRNDSTDDIDASYNYWGTTVELEIQNLIYDYYDDIITEDYSIDAINGVVNYKPWTNEAHSRLFPFAQTLDLDGKEDYVNIGDSSSLVMEDALTVEAWIYPMGPGSGGIIVNKEGEYEIARFGDGTISFAIANNDPGWDWIDTGYRASLNAWVHIAWTYSAADGILKIFVNGVQVFSIAGNGNIGDYHPSENDFRIGGRQCCGEFFDGFIDEIRIFNYARTREEIQSTMNTTLQGDEFGLVGYWNFDGSGANDSSPHGNHGALMGDAEIVPLYGTWPPPKRGDVSGNGQITAYDAALILQYVVGMIDEFPSDSMVSPSAIEPRDYELSLPNLERSSGEKIQVPIAINNATGLLAGGITIKYDSTVLRAVDYAPLKLLNGYYWKANTDLTGEVRFAFATTEVVTTVGQGNLLMVEFEVPPNAEGMTSTLILKNVNLSNSRSITNINGEVRVIPSNFALLQNFPNPFNPDTWLPYKLASASPVSISIYNAKGQLIRTLHFGYQNAGVYVTKGKAAYWDGRDNVGEKVGSGVYFYMLQAGEFASTRKLVIVK